jgi:hypothetical protein
MLLNPTTLTSLRYVTFNYDGYDNTSCTPTSCTYSPNKKIVVRGVSLLDYTPGGPDFNPALFGQPANGPSYCQTGGADTVGICSAPLTLLPGRNVWFYLGHYEIGGNDEIHGEAGDDTAYGGVGNDVIYGDAQDDDLLGGWGNDWFSGGTGIDGILGDDGRIFDSRNSSSGVSWNGSTWVSSCVGTYTQIKPGVFVPNENCFSEPLYGVAALVATDPDAKTSQGWVLSEYIYTPGQVQTAWINIAGALKKQIDSTPFNLGPNDDGQGHLVLDMPLFDANNSDDVIFGGWDDDFLHGGAGDDAMMGGEALTDSYVQLLDPVTGLPTGLVHTDWTRPWNPGDILHFGADTNPWHSNHHNASRLGEFLLYDEYDPRRAILFFDNGQTWSCTAFSPSGHTCTNTGGAAPTNHQFFLNFDKNDGRTTPTGCISLAPNGTCLATSPVRSDGNDAMFGDLGNDWLVGGTSVNNPRPAVIPNDPDRAWNEPKDTLWGGWGNDLLNLDDDLGGCATYDPAGTGFCTTAPSAQTWLNDSPDTHPGYEDRAFGGAGLDILIGNTGGDRLIDWVGEFNSYIVPFAPFGIATVSRQVEPFLPEFLYALSFSEGVDPTRDSDQDATSTDLQARNGELFGEIGLVVQQDHGYWQQQTGGPSDPQAGNIPGGQRDVLRGADFNNGSMQGFAVDSGVWAATGGTLQVAAASLGLDAAAVFYADVYLPVYYEIAAAMSAQKPTAGWKSNSYIMFDYWSPTDFKFAGIDIATNKMVIGHRDATGWHVDSQAPYNGALKEDTTYQTLVTVNGTVVTVSVNSSQAFSYTFGTRLVNGQSVGLNKGLIGFGSDDSRGVLDNIAVQSLPPQVTLDSTEYFEDGVADQFTGAQSGTWAVGSGRYGATGSAISTLDLGASIDATSYGEIEGTLSTTGMGGLVFDAYATNDYKFAALDLAGQRVVVGHVDPKRGWVIDAAFAKSLTGGTDYTLNLALQGTVVTVTLDGSVVGSFGFNSAVADGALGTYSKTGTVSVDRIRVRTNDEAFTGVQTPPELRVGDAVVTEGSGGTTTVTIGLSFTKAAPNATTIGWRTVGGSATGGGDYSSVSAGVVSVASGSTSATIQVTVVADRLYEPDEWFNVELTSWAGFNLADKTGVVTIVNDDVPAVVTVAATDATGGEPGADKVVYTVSRSANLVGALTINLGWGGTAGAGDYAGAVSSITLADGVASGTVTVTPVDDTVVELTETVTLSILAGTGYTVGTPAAASASILDNDKPTASIQVAASVTEGNSGSVTVTLTVTLSAATSSTVTLSYATANGTATAGSDYAAKTGTLTFAAGVTSQTIAFTVYGDRTKEANETFNVTLSAPANATLGTASAIVTIVNDDGSPLLASTSAPGGTAAASLTTAQLEMVVAEAEAAWGADFSGFSFAIGDLDGQMLGVTGLNAITIDPTAAGWGWTLDGGAMDLRTVVLHELGHALGLDHDEAGLMGAKLGPGIVLGVATVEPRTAVTRLTAVAAGGKAQPFVWPTIGLGAQRIGASAWPSVLRPQSPTLVRAEAPRQHRHRRQR